MAALVRVDRVVRLATGPFEGLIALSSSVGERQRVVDGGMSRDARGTMRNASFWAHAVTWLLPARLWSATADRLLTQTAHRSVGDVDPGGGEPEARPADPRGRT